MGAASKTGTHSSKSKTNPARYDITQGCLDLKLENDFAECASLRRDGLNGIVEMGEMLRGWMWND